MHRNRPKRGYISLPRLKHIEVACAKRWAYELASILRSWVRKASQQLLELGFTRRFSQLDKIPVSDDYGNGEAHILRSTYKVFRWSI